VDIRGARRIFGALNEGQGVVTFRFENGVRATMFSGKDNADLGCFIRVSGDKGVLEITTAEPWLRVHELDRPGWQQFDTGESIHDDAAIYRGIDNLLACLETGGTPLLSSKNALRATEIIFAAYESSRRRARVDLPLPPGPSALLEMVASGEMEYKEG
jgi:predicted dehydrogenase